MSDDPRMRGFNYGSPHPSPMPPVYQTAAKIARILGAKATEAGQEAWSLEMALRDVRHAVTAPEKAAATTRLAARMVKYHNLVN